VPLFQAIKVRPYGRGKAQLTGERLDRINAWKMVRRRTKAAGITIEVCNHTFRGAGITAYHGEPRTRLHVRPCLEHSLNQIFRGIVAFKSRFSPSNRTVHCRQSGQRSNLRTDSR
jgi:hypothetical protein